MDNLDWDSIRELDGFRVGDYVRYRGPELGMIRNIIEVKGRHRARVYFATVPFECEGQSMLGGGSEQFIDLDKLSIHVARLPMVPQYCDFGGCSAACWRRCDMWPAVAWRAGKAQNRQPRQKDLFETPPANS